MKVEGLLKGGVQVWTNIDMGSMNVLVNLEQAPVRSEINKTEVDLALEQLNPTLEQLVYYDPLKKLYRKGKFFAVHKL